LQKFLCLLSGFWFGDILLLFLLNHRIGPCWRATRAVIKILRGAVLRGIALFYCSSKNKSVKLREFEGRALMVYNVGVGACITRGAMKMCKEIKGNQRHLTLDDRIQIQIQLEKCVSFKQIARILSKDPTTISKEVKKHRLTKPQTFTYKKGCILKNTCRRKNVCNHIPACKKLCVNCDICTDFCNDFKVRTCDQTDKPPFVCNGCEKRASCKLKKTLYHADRAHKAYTKTLSESRQGIDLTQDQLVQVDEMLTPLIQRGQPIAHIYSSHNWEIPFSSRTLYNYINLCVLGARNIDLQRRVRFKLRKKYKPAQRESESLKGRKYTDFELYIEQNPGVSVVEMDTVAGCKGEKVILTMYFRKSKFMLGFLLENETQDAVKQVFDWLETELTTEVFRATFSIILTDNGSEFLNPYILEDGKSGDKRTRLFYCDPYASHQKGGIEKNHEFIRYISPKGISINHLEQKHITMMMNHINNTARDSLNGLSPQQVSSLHLSSRVFEVLGLVLIQPDKIHLRPELLKTI